jgi:hypothetical protein
MLELIPPPAAPGPAPEADEFCKLLRYLAAQPEVRAVYAPGCHARPACEAALRLGARDNPSRARLWPPAETAAGAAQRFDLVVAGMDGGADGALPEAARGAALVAVADAAGAGRAVFEQLCGGAFRILHDARSQAAGFAILASARFGNAGAGGAQDGPAPLRVAAIATTKNEADVIEGFVRLNARYCDKFCIIDESTDATREILFRLREEGYDIDVYASRSHDFQQERFIGECLDLLAAQGGIDWALLLDADEILGGVERAAFERALGALPPGTLGAGVWRTFIPLSLDYFGRRDPLQENFLPRRFEPSTFYKVFVPRALFGRVDVEPGNHGVVRREGRAAVPAMAMPGFIGHFPVRSAEQIIFKNVATAHMLAAKINRRPTEGVHVFRTLEKLRQSGFSLGYEALRDIALEYADFDRSRPCAIDANGAPIRPAPAACRYLDLARINLLSLFDREIEAQSAKILRYRRTRSEAAQILQTAEFAGR